MIEHICAWCGKKLTSQENLESTHYRISHGICEECKDIHFHANRESLNEFLDRIDAPVFVMDESGQFISANKKGLFAAQKTLEEVEGSLEGEVFECVYADQPDGCGNTRHCNGCIIRRTILDTFKTGESNLFVPVTIDKMIDGTLVKQMYTISTEKSGNLVLLRIDTPGSAQ
ncbi:MAG: hypothetical protein JW904_05075 [Spirochaetales bacterium]|nr:hypothetical protein [Spirochaetales bacterium]